MDTTIAWLQAEYESIFKDGLRAMKVHRGKIHKYPGISLDFSVKGQCCVTMRDYLDGILESFDLAMNEHGNGYLTVGNDAPRQVLNLKTSLW